MTDDYDELAHRFDAMTSARAEAQRLSTRRANLAPQLSEARAEVRRLEAELAKEAGDVRRFEGGLSPTRVWASMRGGLDTRLERERAEEQAAAFALQRAQEQLGRIEAEDATLRAQLAALGDVTSGYEDTLAQVHRLAHEADAGPLRERSAEAGRRLEDLRWKRELDEALHAGEQARAALEGARTQLGNASAWSIYDTFGGGGMLSSMLKHDRLDKATSLLDEAAAAMQRFSRELADVELPGVNAPVVDQLSRGLDIWFDNFVTDVLVGQRIDKAKGQVDDALASVAETMSTLERLRSQLG